MFRKLYNKFINMIVEKTKQSIYKDIKSDYDKLLIKD
mgnify:FL=1|jgi:hypothetical protein